MQLNVGENRSTTTIVKIMSGRNCRELRPCRSSYSPREAAAQYTASQETTSKNWREFRPCQRLFLCASAAQFSAEQKRKKHSKKIGESSVSIILGKIRQHSVSRILGKSGHHSIAIILGKSAGVPSQEFWGKSARIPSQKYRFYKHIH